MTSGGARSRSGPKKDPNALRRERKNEPGWLTVPRVREAPAPEWPLTAATPREKVIWTRWWKLPEAHVWEIDGTLDYVALTVRMFAEAEVKKASAENRKTVRMMMADLYMTQDAKDRARIQVAGDELEMKRDEKAPTAPAKQTSSRDRMKVVSGGAG